MIITWLLLYLGTLLHGLTLYGFDGRRPASLLLLLPLAFLLPSWKRRRPGHFPPWTARLAGIAALACAIAFLRLTYLDFWSTEGLKEALLLSGLGLGSLWVAVARETSEGAPAWIWVAIWLLAGFLDPLLPFLGAGAGAAAAAFGGMPERAKNAEAPEAPILPRPFLALFLLGLALPKPWWDWGLEPDGALPGATFALGAALAHLHTPRQRLRGLHTWGLLAAAGALAILYGPTLQCTWGLLLGLLGGTIWIRLPRPLSLPRLAGGLLAGIALSFALHANAGLPGLRHLLWLGN